MIPNVKLWTERQESVCRPSNGGEERRFSTHTHTHPLRRPDLCGRSLCEGSSCPSPPFRLFWRWEDSPGSGRYSKPGPLNSCEALCHSESLGVRLNLHLYLSSPHTQKCLLFFPYPEEINNFFPFLQRNSFRFLSFPLHSLRELLIWMSLLSSAVQSKLALSGKNVSHLLFPLGSWDILILCCLLSCIQDIPKVNTLG